MTHSTADLEWRKDSVPVSRQFDDPYYSLDNGLGEARHVYLAGNALPERFKPGFHIAELGFGTGLNMLVALMAWRESGQTGPLRYTGFEAYPLTSEEIATALSAFPAIRSIARPLLEACAAGRQYIETDELVAHIIHGDARYTLPVWSGIADAWFLDGFAPARNPELWEPDLLRAVAHHTALGGTCATFTAAGMVRRALSDAGFAITRVPGFGRKRHMTIGKLA